MSIFQFVTKQLDFIIKPLQGNLHQRISTNTNMRQSQGLMSYGSCNPRCHDSRMPDAWLGWGSQWWSCGSCWWGWWWRWGWQWWSCGSDNINRSANITRSTCSISDFEALFKQSAHKCLAKKGGATGTGVSGTDEGIFHQNENEDMKKVSDSLIVTFICLFRMQVQ